MSVDGFGTWPASCRLAARILGSLMDSGVRDIVYCPGSRSAPLAYVLDVLTRAGRLRAHVRVDERSAGFLAVGLIRGSRTDFDGQVQHRPVAVVTTSGTAVAELHPAVAEAAHSHLPLIVISADRPFEMRGVGASQTTDQVGILAPQLRQCWDVPADSGDLPSLDALVGRAAATAMGAPTGDPGPVQLNVGFRDPLTPGHNADDGEVLRIAEVTAPRVHRHRPAELAWEDAVEPGLRTVIVAGSDAGAEALTWAERANVPLIAEPGVFSGAYFGEAGAQGSVGARAGAVLPHQQSLLLRQDLTQGIQQVVLTGRPTLSRAVSRLLARPDVRLVVVAPTLPWPDVAGQATQVVAALAVPLRAHETPGWTERWTQAAADENARIGALLNSERGAASALKVAVDMWEAGGQQLVVGASNPVRSLDLAASGPGPCQVVANRGLAGIDGTVATAIGAALAADVPTRALMGDLTFFHDAGALAIPSDGPTPDLQIVVVDDGGGSIFATLEHGHAAQPTFDRWFRTAQNTSISDLCRAYGVAYRAVTPGQVKAALAEWAARGRGAGIEILHVAVADDPQFYAEIRGGKAL